MFKALGLSEKTSLLTIDKLVQDGSGTVTTARASYISHSEIYK